MNNPLNEAFDHCALGIRTVEAPSTFTTRFDYLSRTDGLPVYAGTAPGGTKTSSNIWIIYKYTYDSSNRCTAINIAKDAIWDNRDTTVVYG